jgi:lectin-like protein
MTSYLPGFAVVRGKAFVALGLGLLLGQGWGCADVLGIPSNPRLVEATPTPAGETVPPLEVPSEGAPDPRTDPLQNGDPGSSESNGGATFSPPIGNPAGAGGASTSGPGGEALDAGTGVGDASAPLPADGCAVSESLGPNGNCYLPVVTLLSWDDARLSCRAHAEGWDLAAIRSEETNRFLSELAPSEAWIGGSDAEDEGTWLWVNEGDAFWSGNGVSGSVLNGAFENWNTDEPNGAGNSDCARLVTAPGGVPSPLPTWADLECFELRGSVCEGPAL